MDFVQSLLYINGKVFSISRKVDRRIISMIQHKTYLLHIHVNLTTFCVNQSLPYCHRFSPYARGQSPANSRSAARPIALFARLAQTCRKNGSSAGFAMVFALLIAPMIWNVGTWYFGLPASSSHTLIGSIIGVGIVLFSRLFMVLPKFLIPKSGICQLRRRGARAKCLALVQSCITVIPASQKAFETITCFMSCVARQDP
jgi:hypothetical protein